MKIKEIDRTANVAWSPAIHHPIYLAAGTAAQQLDATFSTTASLEIYTLNLTEPGLDMALNSSIVSEYRFHKLIWGCEGIKSSKHCSGVLVGGADGGNMLIYDPAKLIDGESALIHHEKKHTGPVHSLDFNKFQDFLLASGSSDSEIFVWDLNNPGTAMTPGAKSQPVEDVSSVAWNHQVQHILASTFPARCVVWDLRKNEPIIKVSDSTSKVRYKMVAWHPEIATQLCLASEDDHCPLIQLWDLRFATSPLRTLEHHQRGVLSIAWSPRDPDLLLSCGKDNRILCWNPNSDMEKGEIVCELPTGNQWSFDVAWCPRNPAVIASSSCDGHVGVFSLMGGQQQVQCSSKIAESFPGADKFMQPPVSSATQRHVSMSLRKPPKWLRKPVGASFGFGGKLVSFINDSSSSSAPGQITSRTIFISQVTTEQKLLSDAANLEAALTSGNLTEFCQSKIDISCDEHEKTVWSFFQAMFSSSPRTKMLSLLGYDFQKIIYEVNAKLKNKNEEVSHDVNELTSKISEMSVPNFGDADCGTAGVFETIANAYKSVDSKPFLIETDNETIDGLLCQTLLTGNIEAAVSLCLQDNRWADALVLAQAGGPSLLYKTQALYFKSVDTTSAKLISAVVTSDWASVIKNCDIECWKEALAAILTYAKPEEFASLCEILGRRLENEKNGALIKNAILCYVSSGNLESLAQCWCKMNSHIDSPDVLQNLVEQVMILRSAVKNMSGEVPPLQTGTLTTLLGQFAALLASQGNLTGAATYLVDSNEQTLAILRDRIYQSLSIQTPLFPFPHIDVHRSSSVTPVQYESVKPVFQERRSSFQQAQPQFSGYSPTTMPSSISTYIPPSDTTLQYSTPSIGSSGVLPSHQMPPPAPASVPLPPPDQAPASTGKGSSHILSHRYPRHLHDPSIYSENNQHYYQQHMLPADPQVQMSNYGQQGFSHTPSSFYSGEHSVAPNYYGSSNPSGPYSSHLSGPYSNISAQVSPPVTLSGNIEPANPVNISPSSIPNAYGEIKTAWNDPPLLRQGSVQPSPPPFDNPTPITTPFIGGIAPEIPQSPPLQADASACGYAPTLQSQFPVPAHSTSGPVMPSQVSSTELLNVPEPPREKGPIPPEHQILQDTFEDLRQQCHQVATNPQTRRKLEDVAKKLETLYDSLREKSLSSAVTHGLHQIVQAISEGNYQTALSIHGQLVQAVNFSEISGFMPSVKVLLQTASQLGVFLR